MPYPLPLTRTEAYLAYKAGVIQQSDLKPSLAVPRNGIDAWLAYWTGLAADYPKREDGTPHILQEEEAYIAYLSGVINEYPEKCLRRVGAYLRYLISARWGRPDHPLNREELYLSLLKTQFIPSGDPSSDIVIDGTAKAPFVDVKMYGDTFQQSYTGQNLYNVDTLQTSAHVTKDDDGWITITRDNSSGSSTSYTNAWTGNLNLETNTQYAIIIEIKEASGTGELDITSTNSTQGQFSSWQSRQVASLAAGQVFKVAPTTKSSFSGIYGGLRTILNLQAGQSASVTFRLSVLADASVAPSGFVYEPYTGEQPSPNPEYPQPIQTVTGLQTVEIVGKNKYPFNDTVWSSPQTASQWSFQNGSTNAYGANITDKTAYKFTLPAGTYTMTAFDLSSNIINIQACTNGESSETIVTSPSNINSENLSSTITLTETTTLCVRYRTTNPSLGIGNTKIQIELGSTATAYAPYHATSYPIDLGSIELCKLDTYQDYIWKDGDDWKVHKATSQITLDGVVGTYSNISNLGSYTRVRVSVGTGKVNDIGESDMFVFKNAYAEDSAHFYVYNNFFWIFVPTAELSSIDENGVRAWFAEFRPTFYYALATATDTVITNQALIDQLNALKQGGAEEGTTYIKVYATDPNLPAKLYVEAPKYA